MVLRSKGDVDVAWKSIGGVPLIVEGFVPFQRELSIVAARSRGGETAFYPLVENVHRDGILRITRAPAPNLKPELQHSAEEMARKVFEALKYAGVLTIELFEHQGRLLANEMATRVHNSGHWTIEGAETSQFENHLRAIAGLPLGSTAALGHSAMINLIGKIPDTSAVLAVPGAHLHLYGKTPKKGRKVGHITIVSQDLQSLDAHAKTLQRLAD